MWCSMIQTIISFTVTWFSISCIIYFIHFMFEPNVDTESQRILEWQVFLSSGSWAAHLSSRFLHRKWLEWSLEDGGRWFTDSVKEGEVEWNESESYDRVGWVFSVILSSFQIHLRMIGGDSRSESRLLRDQDLIPFSKNRLTPGSRMWTSGSYTKMPMCFLCVWSVLHTFCTRHVTGESRSLDRETGSQVPRNFLLINVLCV